MENLPPKPAIWVIDHRFVAGNSQLQEILWGDGEKMSTDYPPEDYYKLALLVCFGKVAITAEQLASLDDQFALHSEAFERLQPHCS